MVGFSAFAAGVGAAGAAPLEVDPDVPVNGAPAPGYSRTPLLTPPESPIQVPQPTEVEVDGTIRNVVYPFIAPWLHNAIPVPAATAFEAAGTAQATLPGSGVSVNPAGHCVFVGPGITVSDTESGELDEVPLPQVRFDTPLLKISIDPSLWVPTSP